MYASLLQVLVNERWIVDMVERKIPMTPGMQPLMMLSDDAGELAVPVVYTHMMDTYIQL